MTCAGICIMNTVQAGFVFSGSVGTGIFMKRNLDETWSNPVAVGLTGVGFGLVIGSSLKDVIVFMPDEASVQSFFSRGVTVGAQTNVTIVYGRENDAGFGASGSGMSTVLSIAYTKGAFVGVSLEGAVVAPRTGANEAFYGPGNRDPSDIIENKITFPLNKITLINEVKEKLGKLSMGMSETPKEAEKKKQEQAFAEAEKAAEEIHKSSPSDVVHVDAKEEAAKGK